MSDENDLKSLLGREFPKREDDVAGASPRLTELQRELAEASTQVRALYNRVRAGETSVRAEMELAMRREDELSAEFAELRRSLGIVDAPIMYGPPSTFRRDE